MTEQTMNTIENQTINGVDVAALTGVIEAVKGTPAIADFRFTAESEWVDGALHRATIESFYGACADQRHSRRHEVTIDEPAVLLGTDKGPNPAEFTATALAGCLATTLVLHAAARGIKLNALKARVDSRIDLHALLGLPAGGANVEGGMQVELDIDADASDAAIAELIEAVEVASPVLAALRNPVPVSIRRRA